MATTRSRIRAGWRDLAEGLRVAYANCPSDEDVLAAARHQARAWADRFERMREGSLSAEETSALEREAEDIVRCHWSPESVLPSLLDMSAVADAVNGLCRCAPPLPGRHWPGDGMLTWREEVGGVRFCVAPPLLRAYVAARRADDLPDDGMAFRDIGLTELLLTMRHACGPVVLDLAEWHWELDDPHPREVARFVSRRRSRTRLSGQRGDEGAQSLHERMAR